VSQTTDEKIDTFLCGSPRGFSSGLGKDGETPFFLSDSEPKNSVEPEAKTGSNENLNLPFLIFHFSPERAGAVSAEVFVFVSIGQNEQKALANGHRLSAAGTK
jgi:hypothetical protein